jgi:dopamine beta-monooxygenase
MVFLGMITPVLAAIGLCIAHAFPSNRNRLPNGFRVPCPEGVTEGCENGLCAAIGHGTCKGGTFPLNQFGTDMELAGHKWTKELCEKDSDGDGLTNGEELGDPCCLFEGFDIPSDYTQTMMPSHPAFNNSKLENYARPDCDITVPKGKSPPMGKFNEGEVQKMIEVFIDDYEIQMPGDFGEATDYVDIAWNFNDDSADEFHVVSAEGIVALPKNLHHYVVYGCSGKFPEDMHGKPLTRSNRDRMTAAGVVCPGSIWGAWVPGRNILDMPSWAGQAVGKKVGVESFRVNVHYDNPDLEKGIISRDGMRLHYTPTLRKETLATFYTMQVSVNPFVAIPPKKPRYFMSRSCDLKVTDGQGQDKEAQILFISFHAHLLGREMFAEFERNGSRSTLSSNHKWYFDDQFDENVYARNLTLKTGDKLHTTCVFSSLERETLTLIGPETRDEMCWGTFVFTHGNTFVNCTGNIMTGELGADESGLGLNLRHNYTSADIVLDGSDLRSGGKLLKINEDLMVCSEHPMLSDYCPFIAMMAPQQPDSCDKNFGELQISQVPEDLFDVMPLTVCCNSFCGKLCPEHSSCSHKKQLKSLKSEDTTSAAPETTSAAPTTPVAGNTHGAAVNTVVKIEGLDYNKLIQVYNIEEKTKLIDEVKTILLAQLPSDYNAQDLVVKLQRGSVLANVTINTKTPYDRASVIATLNGAKTTVQTEVVQRVRAIALAKDGLLEDGKTISDITATVSDAIAEAVNAGNESASSSDTVQPLTSNETVPPQSNTETSEARYVKVSSFFAAWFMLALLYNALYE